jgi:hypothetical protein
MPAPVPVGAAGAVATFLSGVLLCSTWGAVLGAAGVFALLACFGATLAERLVFWTEAVGLSALLGVGDAPLDSVWAMFCITISLS